MKNTLDRTIPYGFIALIVFSALAHGTVEPWSQLIFTLWIAALVLLWMIKSVRERKVVVYIPRIVWPLGAFILLGGAQSLTVKDPNGYIHSLSSDPEATRETILMLACMLVASLVAANFLAHRQRLRELVLFLTFFGLTISTFALVQYFTWNDRFYWFRATDSLTALGPFVNRNHFAGYIELLLPWPAIMMLSRHRREEKLFYGFAAAWMAMAVMFSQSRGGMVSIFAQLMFLTAFRPVEKRDELPDYLNDQTGLRRFGAFLVRTGAIAGIVAAVMGGVLWLGAERVTSRFVKEQEPVELTDDSSIALNVVDDRTKLWQGSWALFRDRPWTGAGLGTFETVFPAYNLENNTGSITSQTHNDYLQVLTDGGLIGGGIALWFLITLAKVIGSGIRSRQPMMNLYALGCGTSIVGLLVHSLFDFNLQLPSHALLFITFSAIAGQLCELATLMAAAHAKLRPIADAKRILLARRKHEA
jgi:O-antigen ligase